MPVLRPSGCSLVPRWPRPDNVAVTEPTAPATSADQGKPGAWAALLAAELSEAPLTPSTVGAVLRVARDVAHATERLNAPLCAYVAGRHVEARLREGCDEDAAIAEVDAAVRRLLEGRPTG